MTKRGRKKGKVNVRITKKETNRKERKKINEKKFFALISVLVRIIFTDDYDNKMAEFSLFLTFDFKKIFTGIMKRFPSFL